MSKLFASFDYELIKSEFKKMLKVYEIYEILDVDTLNRRFGKRYHWVHMWGSPFEIEKGEAYIPFKGIRVGEYEEYYIAPLNRDMTVDLDSAIYIFRLPFGTFINQVIYDPAHDNFICFGKHGGLAYWRLSKDFKKIEFRRVIRDKFAVFLPAYFVDRLVGALAEYTNGIKIGATSSVREEPLSLVYEQPIYSLSREATDFEGGSSCMYADYMITLTETRMFNKSPFYPFIVFTHVQFLSGRIFENVRAWDYYLPCFSRLKIAIPQSHIRPLHIGHPQITIIYGRPILFCDVYVDYDVILTGKFRTIAIPIDFEVLSPESYRMLKCYCETYIASEVQFRARNANGAKYCRVALFTRTVGASFDYVIENEMFGGREEVASGTGATSVNIAFEPAENVLITVKPSTGLDICVSVMFLQ